MQEIATSYPNDDRRSSFRKTLGRVINSDTCKIGLVLLGAALLIEKIRIKEAKVSGSIRTGLTIEKSYYETPNLIDQTANLISV